MNAVGKFAQRAINLSNQIERFRKAMDRVLPLGTVVRFRRPGKCLLEGKVSENQFTAGERPDGGLILDVEDEVYEQWPPVWRICKHKKIIVIWTFLEDFQSEAP